MEDNNQDEIKALEEKLKALKQKNVTPRITLEKTNQEGLSQGHRGDGMKYSVRENRDRLFFPDEWLLFFNRLTEKQKLTFDLLINTGARFKENYHIKVGDIDTERGNIILRVTKIKAKENQKNPKPRTISISTQLTKRLSAYIKKRKLNNDDYLNLMTKPGAYRCMKVTLAKIGIKDWYMFGLHNIRKTHGNWLKALGVDGNEICLRLSHDFATFKKHYGSPDIYNADDKKKMREILGDLYQKQ